MCVAAQTLPRRRASVQALTCQFAQTYKKASGPGGLHALTLPPEPVGPRASIFIELSWCVTGSMNS